MNISVQRIYQDDCTVGVLNTQDGSFRCLTLELPDLDNQKNISCIPEGLYKYKKIASPSLGWCLDVLNVDGRTHIRIHAGNYTSQIQGCILVGSSLTDINKDGILDVGYSKSTLVGLLSVVGDEGYLTIS